MTRPKIGIALALIVSSSSALVQASVAPSGDEFASDLWALFGDQAESIAYDADAGRIVLPWARYAGRHLAARSDRFRAVMLVGEIHRRAGRLPEAIAAFERAALLERESQTLGGGEARREALSAQMDLARALMVRGDYESALDAWRRCRPASHCGNCQEAILVVRQRGIIECFEALDAHGRIVDAILDGLRPWGEREGDGRPDVVVVDRPTMRVLIDSADRCGRLDEVEGWIERRIEAKPDDRRAKAHDRLVLLAHLIGLRRGRVDRTDALWEAARAPVRQDGGVSVSVQLAMRDEAGRMLAASLGGRELLWMKLAGDSVLNDGAYAAACRLARAGDPMIDVWAYWALGVRAAAEEEGTVGRVEAIRWLTVLLAGERRDVYEWVNNIAHGFDNPLSERLRTAATEALQLHRKQTRDPFATNF